MAPVRNSSHRNHAVQSRPQTISDILNADLFLEPMMGTPLQMYIEKDVADRDLLVDLVTKHGGVISPGYSGVPYILVDPHKESGQNLYRQYVGKKGKIVLNARWVHECIKAGALQTFQGNFAGCKVDGSEVVGPPETQPAVPQSTMPAQGIPPRHQSRIPNADLDAHQLQPSHALHSQPMDTTIPPVDPLQPANPFPYPVYAIPSRGMHPATAGPPQTWQAPNGIAPQQTHLAPPPHMISRGANSYREDAPWDGTYDHAVPPGNTIVGGPPPTSYDYRYRDEPQEWVGGPNDYYDSSQYDQGYGQPNPYMQDPNAGPSTLPTDVPEKTRGRKRSRTQATPAAPASALVMNRRHPPGRSPTPPTRVIKSTYGGNLFTSDDVMYLKKYIDYCQEQGLVLSLREICERIAVKAPHHTFYSWRRYCNKHQIRLGGYTMNADRSPSPQQINEPEPDEEDILSTTPPQNRAGTIAAARQLVRSEGDQIRNRSPTPPRALFRSTTGKGVAFTDEDIAFLVRFMDYRKSQGRLDMVAFWKDVAVKAPHHSRASWMKFWRRHKHELNRTDTDDPLPQPPEKKMRYSREDDILLAKYFFDKPEGTSDKIFQAFGRMHPHHPWKGWQEHHRIHKAKIDHFIQQLANGGSIDTAEQEE